MKVKDCIYVLQYKGKYIKFKKFENALSFARDIHSREDLLYIYQTSEDDFSGDAVTGWYNIPYTNEYGMVCLSNEEIIARWKSYNRALENNKYLD